MEKKKLILINEIMGLNQMFTQAFINEGYEVFSILREPITYKKNLRTKLLNIYYRTILKDNSFFGKDYHRKLNKEVYRRLKKIDTEVDYAVVFSAHYYPEKIIKLLRKKAKKMIAYQCDGWRLCKGIVQHKDYFDRCFFFDKDDLPKFGDNALPLTNCYFTNDADLITNTLNEIDVFYLGGGTPSRIGYMKNLDSKLQEKFSLKAILTIPEYQKETRSERIELLHKGISYSENINLVKKSKCLVDIKFDYHNGLSFRFFEALYYKKKLITNNESVKNYDFYHPNNIFITDFENLDGIEEFLEKPYIEIDEKIVEKYGFPNWHRYLLDIPPYQQITNG